MEKGDCEVSDETAGDEWDIFSSAFPNVQTPLLEREQDRDQRCNGKNGVDGFELSFPDYPSVLATTTHASTGVSKRPQASMGSISGCDKEQKVNDCMKTQKWTKVSDVVGIRIPQQCNDRAVYLRNRPTKSGKGVLVAHDGKRGLQSQTDKVEPKRKKLQHGIKDHFLTTFSIKWDESSVESAADGDDNKIGVNEGADGDDDENNESTTPLHHMVRTSPSRDQQQQQPRLIGSGHRSDEGVPNRIKSSGSDYQNKVDGKCQLNTGRWSKDENNRCKEGLRRYGTVSAQTSDLCVLITSTICLSTL